MFPATEPTPFRLFRSGLGLPLTLLYFGLTFCSTLLLGVSFTQYRPAELLSLTWAEALAAAILLFIGFSLLRQGGFNRKTLLLWVIPGGMLCFLTHSLLPTGMLLGWIFTMGKGGILLATAPKRAWPCIPLLPLAAYGLTLLLSRDPLGSLVVLLPWPATWVLTRSTRRSTEGEDPIGRVSVICRTALTLGLSISLFLLLSLWVRNGSLRLSLIPESLETLRHSLIDTLYDQPMPEGLTPELAELWKEMYTYANLENMVNDVFNILPALGVLVSLGLAAAAQLLFYVDLLDFEMRDLLPLGFQHLELSLHACVVFLLASLWVFLEQSVISTFSGTVARNIYLILLPGLALSGLLHLHRFFTRNRQRPPGCLFFLILPCFCLLFSAPYILAAGEVIVRLYKAIASKLKPNEDNDPF